MSFVSPRGSRISVKELAQEVDEYFIAGVQVEPGDVVFDVGANIGCFSLKVAEKCQGNVSLYCFEPSPPTFAALKTNLGRHPLFRKVEPRLFPVGLTSPKFAGQKLSFFNFRRFPTNNTFDLNGKRREFEIFFESRGKRIRQRCERALPGKSFSSWVGAALETRLSAFPRGKVGWWLIRSAMGLEEVEGQLDTLSQIVAKNQIRKIDLLKVDVEGHELDVLEGIQPEDWSMIRQVVLETNPIGGRKEAIEGLLHKNGFQNVRCISQNAHDNGLESVILLATRSN